MSTFTLENKTNQTVPAAADILPIVDVSDSNQLNKMTVQNLMASPQPIGATTANTGAFTTLSASGQATFQNGSVAAPAIAFASDTDTGFIRAASNVIDVVLNGASFARFGFGALIMLPNDANEGGQINLNPGSSYSGDLQIDQSQDNGRLFWSSTSNKTLQLFNHGSGTFSLDIGGVAYFESYTVATVPSASIAGGFIYVSDETGGATMAFSDGTNWRRVQDRAVVS